MRYLLLFLALHITATAQTTKIIGADLQHYWAMEDGSGTNVADKVSSGGQAGTTVASPTWTTGVLGGALSFNGTSQYVTFGNTFEPVVTQPVSFSCWVFDTLVDGTSRVLFGNQSVTGAGHQLSVGTSNQIRMRVSDGTNTKSALSAATITANVWHFAAGTWDGTNAISYLDGVGTANVGGAVPLTIVYDTTLTSIARNQPAAGNYWSGKIDDFKCYNHAMTASEVKYLFYAGRQGSQ